MENIAVAIRFRPSTAAEAAVRQWRIDNKRISLHRHDDTTASCTFAFDHVFDQASANATVYDVITRPIIQAAVHGFNGTAFAYGQTSSGKTYTMNGSDKEPGLIPLAVKDVFDTIGTVETDREFLIRVSYMEIYNEEINDLLCLGNMKLPLHESLERGVFVAGLREEIVNSASQVFELIKLGEENRHFGETNMNSRSSRSHTIFRMVIESSTKNSTSSCDLSNADAIRVSVLNLVDLAGSERIAKTGADGVRLKEGKYINKSLMVLGNVINKLSEGKQRVHIPYRDSKLTRILQSALGGNAKTSIICTVAPEEVHVEETRGTLQFASRAKRITNCAQINEILTDAALLKRQKLEIEELRSKLQGSHSEVLEQVILKQRNDMLKSEMERDKLAMELQEERRCREALEHQIREQQKKIENLSDCSCSSQHHQNSVEVSSMDINWRASYNKGPNKLEADTFTTPNLKAIPKNFIAKRSNYSKTFDSTPIPDDFGNIADEDMWLRLNKGCITDLEMVQMTPVMKNQACASHGEYSKMAEEDKDATKEKYDILEEEHKLYKQELVSVKEQYNVLEKECNHLKQQIASLIEALSTSEQSVELLRAENQGLQNELEIDKGKMKNIEDEFKLFSLEFAKRQGMLTSLHSKSKAMVENLRSFKVLIPEVDS